MKQTKSKIRFQNLVISHMDNSSLHIMPFNGEEPMIYDGKKMTKLTVDEQWYLFYELLPWIDWCKRYEQNLYSSVKKNQRTK